MEIQIFRKTKSAKIQYFFSIILSLVSWEIDIVTLELFFDTKLKIDIKVLLILLLSPK